MAGPRHQPATIYLDGVSSRDLRLALVTPKGVVKDSVVVEGTRTEYMMGAIESVSRRAGSKFRLAVAQGGGSFTQSRLVCAVTNALAYARGLKLATAPAGVVPRRLPALVKSLRWGNFVWPSYGAAKVATPPKRALGFTLIELLVVIAIIAILATIAVVALNTARAKGREARARGDLKQMRTAIALLEDDTGKWPNGCTPNTSGNPEVALDQPRAGLRVRPTVGTVDTCTWTQAEVDRWNGPYIDRVIDPWGVAYEFDPDYTPYSQPACATPNEPETVVVVSYGPNKVGRNVYDCDDIFLKIK